MYYEIYGDRQPLVLLRGGLLRDRHVLRNVLPGLANTRQVIGLEIQAHGRTADIYRPLSPEQMAEDTVAALEHLDIKKGGHLRCWQPLITRTE